MGKINNIMQNQITPESNSGRDITSKDSTIKHAKPVSKDCQCCSCDPSHCDPCECCNCRSCDPCTCDPCQCCQCCAEPKKVEKKSDDEETHIKIQKGDLIIEIKTTKTAKPVAKKGGCGCK